jgi:hypothetical protein
MIQGIIKCLRLCVGASRAGTLSYRRVVGCSQFIVKEARA